MEGWSDFYTLVGSTAATLIGLIFVVISLGADHAKKGDEHRLRVGVTPTLVHFASLLFSALAMMAPLSEHLAQVRLFEQGEIDHVEPAEDPVDDGPQDRMVVGVGNGDGERGTEAHAIFHALRAVIVRSIHANRSFAL